jgi:hypothetical protein
MGTTRDLTAATWTRRVKKWRRWAEEMKAEAGFEVIEPPSLDTPPVRRIADTSTAPVY